MSLSIATHNLIQRHNILTTPTNRINVYFSTYRGAYKIALLANHIFRAAAMAALMSAGAGVFLCFAGSLFYRLTVENHCAYKFALPAFAGACAFLIGKAGLASLASGSAFASLGAFSVAVVPLLPLAAYAAYIGLTVDYDVWPCL
jgi:hypothetical protein